MINGLILLDPKNPDLIYGPEECAKIARQVNLVAPPLGFDRLAADAGVLQEVEALFTGWGAPPFSMELLWSAPKLRVVFYAGGSIRYLVNDAFWARGIRITTSYALNAQAVAEYTVGAVLFGLKHGFVQASHAQRHGAFSSDRVAPGNYRSTVGIISYGAAGRAVHALLRHFDHDILIHDPYLDRRELAGSAAELVSLDEVFARSDAVTLHTPQLPETENLIRGTHFARMKPGAIFINTARGAIVCESEMIEQLRRRADITAVLDVTEPEPPAACSPLYRMPNVVLTPHIAGAMNRECRRMGQGMIEEFDRWQKGEPMLWEITKEKIVHMA